MNTEPRLNSVFIPLSLDGECQQKELSAMLGQAELLSQLTEECGELIQAAQKMRRVLAGTTPVSQDQALRDLTEEASDVVLILDMLAGLKLLDRVGMRFIGRYKTERWFKRTLEQASQAEPVEYIDRQKLLEQVDAIWDCNDMVFEGDRDHSCRPKDCKGCHWADTKRYIQKLIERAPVVATCRKEAKR